MKRSRFSLWVSEVSILTFGTFLRKSLRLTLIYFPMLRPMEKKFRRTDSAWSKRSLTLKTLESFKRYWTVIDCLTSIQRCRQWQYISSSIKERHLLNWRHFWLIFMWKSRKLSSLRFISSVKRLCVIREQYLENSFGNKVCCTFQPSSNHFDFYFSWIQLNFHISA